MSHENRSDDPSATSSGDVQQSQASLSHRTRRSEASAQARQPLIEAEVEARSDERITQIRELSGEEDEALDEEEMMKYGASHVVRLFIPVSICMSLVVVSISAIKYYTVKEPGQFFIYTPFSESSQSNSGGIVLVSLMNALVFIGVVLVMTVILIMLYKYRCYAIIHGWLVLSTLLLLFMFAFIYVAEMIKALNVSADWISLCVLIWNFGVAGLCSIHWKAPLHLQQAYHISMSVLMALVLIKWLPDWTGWVILGALAIYDLLAVLCPFGPLNILVKTAKERNENVFPALIYSSGMVRVGKPGGRFGESNDTAEAQAQSANGETETESVSGSTTAVADADGHERNRTRGDAAPGESDTGLSGRENASLLVTMAASPPKSGMQQRSTIPLIESNPLSLVITASDTDEQQSSKQGTSAGSSKSRSAASHRGAANASTSGVQNSAAELESNEAIEQQPQSQSQSRSAAQARGGARSTRAANAAGTSQTGMAGATYDQPEEVARDMRRASAAHSEDSQRSSEAKDRGVKMGLGDFIFYSVLVGKAAQQSGDWTTTIICFVAILIGLGCTLVLLAIFRRALPALPISIAFGLTFFFASSFIVQPFVDTLAVNQVFI